MDYLHGCNYPWSTDGTTVFYGLDFGANVWGSHLGVSTRRDAVARDFARIARLGFTVARWFLFCDGRAGIAYDDRGLPAGFDPHFFGDLDAALEVARDSGVAVSFVLLDHRWMFAGVRHTIADPATGVVLEARLPHGRAQVLLSEHGRDRLFERVFDPLVRRYGPAGARADLGASILGYEFMNEPDFVVEGVAHVVDASSLRVAEVGIVGHNHRGGALLEGDDVLCLCMGRNGSSEEQ